MPSPGTRIVSEGSKVLPPVAAPAAKVTSAAAEAVGGGGMEWGSMGEAVDTGGRGTR